MPKWNWERLAATSGLAFIVLFIVAIAIPGRPPDLDAAATKFEAYILNNARDLKISAILIGLAAVAWIWFSACVAGRLRTAGEQRLAAVAFGGAITVVAMQAVTTGITLGLAYETALGPTPNARELYTVATIIGTLAAFPFAAFTAATAIASWRSKVFPQWYTALTGLGTVAFLVAGGALQSSGFYAPDGTYTMIINIVFMVWVVLTSGVLWMQAEGERAPHAAHSAT